jgi:hypothetical protein
VGALGRGAHSVRARKAAAYDEMLVEVATRIATTGSIGKSDIGALLLWKRLRADTPWARQLMSLAEAEMRTITKKGRGRCLRRRPTVAEGSAPWADAGPGACGRGALPVTVGAAGFTDWRPALPRGLLADP